MTGIRRLIIGCVALFTAICLFVYIPKDRLGLIQHAGVLRVLTRVDPIACFQSPKGYSGLEYDLVELGWSGRRWGQVRSTRYFWQNLRRHKSGKADIAAAGIAITQQRKQEMRFAQAYNESASNLFTIPHHRPKSSMI